MLTLDVIPAVIGDQGDTWYKTPDIDLSPYIGQTVYLRIRAITGTSFNSDIAIDDFGFTGTTCDSDGIVDFGEQCDDGNAISGDGCHNCKLEYCGNGVIDLNWEVCDDGNNTNGDGCNAGCTSDET